MKLYELSHQYKDAVAYFDECEDLDQKVIDDTLDALESEINDKCFNLAAYIKNIDAEATAIKNAEDVMKSRRQALEKKSAWLRCYLAHHLPAKIKNEYHILTPVKPRAKVEVYDISRLPDNCVKTETKPILAEVKKQIDTLPDSVAQIVLGEKSVKIQ